MCVSEVQYLFCDQNIFRIGQVIHNLKLIIRVISAVFFVDLDDVRPVSLIQGVYFLSLGIRCSDRMPADDMIQIQIDIVCDPVIERFWFCGVKS